MADQQLRGNNIRVFNLRVRQYLRKHYKPSKEKYSGICIYCLSEINYKKHYQRLRVHLTTYHPEVLTEEQKTERNIHWTWDYFTPTSDGGQCNICYTRIISGIRGITKHLSIHRETHNIFDPDEVIYEDTYMYGTSTSASGSMIVEDAEYQEASIAMASNLTDDTDRICVPNESATKASEPSEYVASPHENVENIDNVKVPEFKPLSDTEEVADREELPDREEILIGQEYAEMGDLSELLHQISHDIHNLYFYNYSPEGQITYDLPEKE